jgi:uncharacterized protein HemX
MNINASSNENKRSSEKLELDQDFARTMQDFRSCVHAWSDAERTRPRTFVPMQQRLWRLAVGWAMAAVVAVGAVSGGVVYQAHQRQQAALVAAAQAAERQRMAAQKAQEEEDLLAMVDSEVSRQTPRAMEPLAQWMSDEDSK